jgi:hypothetical protein
VVLDGVDGSIDIMDGIDVRQILGFTADDFLPPGNQPGSF